MMPVNALDHYTIRCADMEASVRFYEDVLGLRNGERPPFSFPGAWLYCGGHPVVHLVGGDNPRHDNTGTIDHVAFQASGLDDYTRRLGERGIAFEQRHVPGTTLHQVFLEDPDGITIELNFRDEDEAQAGTAP